MLKQRTHLGGAGRMAAWAVAALLAAIGSRAEAEVARGLESIAVPEGFEVELAAGPELARYPMFAAFDDRGRLFVAESSGKDLSGEEMVAAPECSILLLQDRDGDGRFDDSQVFADGLSLPMGLLWYREALYVASPPDFLRLEDADGDGRAERREVILTGWNVKNTASLHGPFLGPDGRMYLTHGRHGYEIETKEGQKLEGLAARIWRMKPDGTELEHVAGGGFDNPVELVFTDAGDTIGTMTYFTDPRNGQRDALLHFVEGGVYPKPHQAIEEFTRTGELMPVMTKFARIAPAGLVRYRGGAFGPEFTGNLFSAQFNPHRVQRHVLIADGATFRTRDEDFLTSSDPDFYPTDVVEDADGSLLVVVTGAWYVDACPLSRIAKPEIPGGIYRVRRSGAPRIEDPWGTRVALARRSTGALGRYLKDSRAAVRDRAMEELISRGEAALGVLARRKADASDPADRVAALWAIARLDAPRAWAEVARGLGDGDATLRAAAARALGTARRGEEEVANGLIDLLGDPNPAVRTAAAEALGRIGDARASGALLEAAAMGGDRFAEHAIVYALIQLGRSESLDEALDDARPAVRRAALIALDQIEGTGLESARVAPLLGDGDDAMRQAALWVAGRHPEWAEDLVSHVVARLRTAPPGSEEAKSIREALLAFEGEPAAQSAIASLLRDEGLSEERRILVLDVAAQSDLKKLPAAWIEAIGEILSDGTTEERSRALEIARGRGLEELDDRLDALASDPAEPAAMRVGAIEALVKREPVLDPPRFKYLLAQLGRGVEPALRLAAARALARATLGSQQRSALAREYVAQGDSLIVTTLLGAFEGGREERAGLELVQALKAGAASAAGLTPARLEELLAGYPTSVRAAAAPLAQRLDEEELARGERLAELEPLLEGGEVGRGRRVFFGERAACSTCHAIGREGGDLGPDLTSIGTIRSGHDLLEAMVFPSASFVAGYEPLRIETGETNYTGILGRETPRALYLRTGADAEVRLERGSVRSIEPSAVSTMPEGLATEISSDELRDLLAFLRAQNGEQWLQPERREVGAP